MPENIRLLGLNIINKRFSEVINEVDYCLRTKSRKIYFPINVDMVVQSYKDAEFRTILEQNASLLADGMLIIWTSRLFGNRIIEKISGADLFPMVCKLAAEKNYKVFFLGAKPGVAIKAGMVLKNEYPDINIVGTHSPPFGFEKIEEENHRIIDMINATKPDVLFIGLGAPKQEKWIWKYKDSINVTVTICIGAGFDFIAGEIKRAPKWMQKCGLEWFWRLLQEPRRLWKRYLIEDMKFFWIVFKQKLVRPSDTMSILGVRYDNLTCNSAIEKTLSLLKNQSRSNLFFLNYSCLYQSQKDDEYRKILNSADLIFPDGIGIKLITALFGGKMAGNCNGTDFSPLFMERVAKEGYKIFFLGGREGIAQKAGENLRKTIPNIQIVGTHSGYFNNDDEVINEINGSGADILFVGMGAPLQEKWITEYRERLNPRLCLGVGALLDYISGSVPRAPKFMRKLCLEWLWRIFIEPKRMVKRYIIDGTKLFWLILKQKLRTL